MGSQAACSRSMCYFLLCFSTGCDVLQPKEGAQPCRNKPMPLRRTIIHLVREYPGSTMSARIHHHSLRFAKIRALTFVFEKTLSMALYTTAPCRRLQDVLCHELVI